MRHMTAFVAAVALASGAAPALAQTSYVSPSLSVGVAYDDNTTATSGTTEADFLLRVTPSLEGGWRGPRGTFTALHTFDMERYKDNSAFDDVQVRRRTSLDGDYRLSERLDFAGSLSSAASDVAGEIVPEVGLELGRREARRHAADAELGYRVTERMTATVGAGWSRDDVEAGTDATAVMGGVGAAYAANERHTWTGDYVYRRYEFNGGNPIEAHIGLIGWETAMSPRSTLLVQAGPRYTDGETTPEVLVATTYDMLTSSLSFNFARSQSTVLGQAGLADSHSAWATYIQQLGTKTVLQLSPSYSRLERGGDSVEVARALVEAGYLVNRNLSARASYQWSRQDGSLETPGPIELTRNVLFVGLTWDFNPQPTTQNTLTRRRR
ncbi:MAG: hypothetical protein WD081_04995 [Gammaproteobacteria bacterium]